MNGKEMAPFFSRAHWPRKQQRKLVNMKLLPSPRVVFAQLPAVQLQSLLLRGQQRLLQSIATPLYVKDQHYNSARRAVVPLHLSGGAAEDLQPPVPARNEQALKLMMPVVIFWMYSPAAVLPNKLHCLFKQQHLRAFLSPIQVVM